MRALPGWLIGIVIGGAILLAGWLGYALYSPDRAPQTPDRFPASQPDPRDRAVRDRDSDFAGPPGSERPARDVTRRQRPADPPTPIRASELSYQGWEADAADPDQPKACLLFSSATDPADVISDKAFIRIEPEVPFSLQARDRQLCVLGLDADAAYTIRVLPGLTAQNGRVLEQSAVASVSFAPKPAMVGIIGDGIILPRVDKARLGIKAMNADRVALTLYRVNHRALFDQTPNEGETSIEGTWSYSGEAWNSRVEVHSDVIETAGGTNELVEVGYPLADIIEAQGPGAYIVQVEREAGEDERRVASAWRWLYVTDIALASYRSDEALHVTARSIETARTLPGARLALIARNNDMLAEAIADGNGRAVFPGAALKGQGNLAPKMVLAYAGGDDFAALDLSRSPLDLTAFDVAGRDATGPIEAFLYTDRGVYRPGETVRLTGLIRDRSGKAAFNRDGTLTLTKPDGSVFVEERVSPDGLAGAFYRDLAIPRDAPRGRWTVTLELDGLDAPVGMLKVAVEDFVPEQLRLSLRADEAPILSGESRAVNVAADFLYGAAGRGLQAEADARIQVDPNPFPDFKDYQFGNPVEPFREQFLSIGQGLTDDDGRYAAELELGGDAYRSAAPLRAFVTAGVADPGGRYVRDSVFLPVRSEDVYVGFKPGFDNGYVRRNTPAEIALIAVGPDGERVATDATLRLIEEDYDYHWYREDGRWRYRRDRRDAVIAEQVVTIGADAPYTFTDTLNYGQYRLEAQIGDTVAGYQFGSGWRRPGAGVDAPDRIEMGLDAAAFTPGDTLALTLDVPFAGEAELVLADSEVRRVQSLSLQAGAQTVRVRTDADATGDLYVMLTLYSPLTDQAPRRAVGLVHIPLDRAGQRMAVSIDAPDTILPRTSQTVRIALARPVREEAYVTLAAVDTGILQITDFTPPDPEAALFGKRAFPLDVFDDYSRMLAPFRGLDRVGGDVLGGAGLSVVPTQTVALFEGPVRLRDGEASVTLDIPDFQGELTLMAVAWSDDRLGSASTTMTVRDPVTAQLALPRFLAPGDRAVATLALDNVDGRAGRYGSVLTVDGVRLADATTELERGARAEEVFEITSDGVGIQTFGLATRGPGFAVERDYRIETRAASLPRTASLVAKLAPGERVDFNLDRELSPFVPGSSDMSVTASFTPLLDPAPLLESLNRYPYGCTEQTVSVAVPLLLSERVGQLRGMSDGSRRRELQQAVDRILARQDADGAIGLWRQGDGNASPYLQLYASEFLLDAKEAGYAVPDSAVTRTVKAVRELSKLDGRSRLSLDYQYGLRGTNPDYELRRAERAAYAMAVLAKHDRVAKTEAVYLQDRFGERLRDSVSLSQLGFTLDAIGEAERAQRAFALAAERLAVQSDADYYNTPVRNAAALLALSRNLPTELSADVITNLPSRGAERLNTHEKAWLLRAIAQGGQPTDAAPFAGDDGWSALGRGARLTSVPGEGTLSVDNPHDRMLWVTLSVTGQPSELDSAASNGVTLAKSVYAMSGDRLAGGAIQRGERAVILLEAEAGSNVSAMWVLADLLPAGLEIETVLSETDAGETGAFGWLGELTPVDMTESRDDRFIASWRVGDDNRYDTRRKRRVAYVVRAVTEGDFAFPGAHVEDMYRPERNATTAGGRLQVTQAGQL